MTNPFLTPDRVPPPSTRVVAPGTAQPYYSGNPLPGAATSPATQFGAPGAAPPGMAFPPTTAPFTSPPGGWGGYPPQSQAAPASAPITAAWQPEGVKTASAEIPLGPISDSAPSGDSIRMSNDEMPLRFSPTAPLASPLPTVAPAALGSTSEAITPTASTTPSMAPMPIQSILPLTGSQPSEALGAPTFLPNAGAQAPQQLQIREVTPAEYLAPAQQAFASTPTRDGFRPQSSEPRDDSTSGQSFRPPEIRRTSAAQQPPSDQFGIGDNYQSLRGQLEYWPTNGQWSLRYMPLEGQADSLGGRVMIDNPQVLANLQPGEFVQIRGQLYAKPTDTGMSIPTYRVSVIERQRR